MIPLLKQYIFPYIKQYKKMFILTVFLGFLTILIGSSLTFTSGYLITAASERPETILLIYVPIVLVRAFGIGRAVSRYVERLAGHDTVLRILNVMRVMLYDLLEPQALYIRSRFKTGDLIGTLSDDIEHLQDFYIRTIFPTVTAICLFLFSVIGLSIFDVWFALWIAFCLLIIILVYPMISLYMMKKHQMKIKELKSISYQTYTDAIMGLSDWMISGQKKRFIDKFSKNNQDLTMLEQKLTEWGQQRTFQLQMVSAVILVSVGFWASFEAIEGNILPTYVASFTLVTLPILEGLLPVSVAVEKIPAYMESLKRIENIQSQIVQPIEQTATISKEMKPVIQLDDVSYKYDGVSTNAVSSIDLTIPYGKKIAIIGKSGAGKSTLIQLLQGSIQPTSGKVTVGHVAPAAYGEDIFSIISVLNQKPYLFATNVENNILVSVEDATKDQVEDVVNQVRLLDYMDSLPKGLETQMEESGQRFSGGERQRIALARILLKNSPVVILDEPTIGLDPYTEKKLLETVFETLKDKTVLFITHHLIGMERMDEIIFLDKGHITMRGTHEELLQTNERYRNLYELDRGYL